MNNLAEISPESSIIDLKDSNTNYGNITSLTGFKRSKGLLFGKGKIHKEISLLEKIYLEGFMDGVAKTSLSAKEMFVLGDGAQALEKINELSVRSDKSFDKLSEALTVLSNKIDKKLDNLDVKITTINENTSGIKERLSIIETKVDTKDKKSNRIKVAFGSIIGVVIGVILTHLTQIISFFKAIK